MYVYTYISIYINIQNENLSQLIYLHICKYINIHI